MYDANEQMDKDVCVSNTNDTCTEVQKKKNPFLFCHPRLAVSRTNPQVLDTGLMPHDCLPAPNWHSTKGDSGPFLSPFGKDFLTL